MENARYIVRRRARFRSGGRDVNLPYGTGAELQDGWICCQGQRLCRPGSQNALDYFSWDGDGNGRERGMLVNNILYLLEKRDKEYLARWSRVWDSPVCGKYRRMEHADHWLWASGFYNATVEDLRQIADLVGAKV